MSSSSAIIESPWFAGRRLRATLFRAGDRFGHALEIVTADATSFRFAESLDDESGSDWPPSPPLQQLHCEPRPPLGEVALLVGMAGRSHWSLSIEPVAEQAALRFDAACRIDRSPDRLGHAWRLNAALGPANVEPRRASWRWNGATLVLAVEPADALAAPPEVQVNGSECVVRVTPPAAVARFPATVRWRFQWLLQVG